MITPIGEDVILKFKEVKDELESVIEEQLPGDFSEWKDNHLIREGDTTTIDAIANNPLTKTCAWNLFCAAELGADYFGLPKKKPDLDALEELKQSLQKALVAGASLSFRASVELSTADTEIKPTIGGVPARLCLSLAIQDTLACIPHAIMVMEENGAENYRHDVKAAAVGAECRKVFEARSGRLAPKTARDRGQKKTENNKPAQFTEFAQAVFGVLKINTQVSSALNSLRVIQELRENSDKTPE